MFHFIRFLNPISPRNPISARPFPHAWIYSRQQAKGSNALFLLLLLLLPMEASAALICSHPFPSRPSPGINSRPRRQKKLHPGVILASRRDAYDRDNSGRTVDESMVVLRRRIHEMEIAEGKREAPSDWMDWEKRYYSASYYSDICAAVAVLQSHLMNTRPSLALGMVALIALSLPTSVGFLLFHLADTLPRLPL